jgi:hypothetical protein
MLRHGKPPSLIMKASGGKPADPAGDHIGLAIGTLRLARSELGFTGFVCHTEMPTLS